MNRLASILPPAQVLVGVDATSKKRAFEEAGLLFENLRLDLRRGTRLVRRGHANAPGRPGRAVA